MRQKRREDRVRGLFLLSPLALMGASNAAQVEELDAVSEGINLHCWTHPQFPFVSKWASFSHNKSALEPRGDSDQKWAKICADIKQFWPFNSFDGDAKLNIAEPEKRRCLAKLRANDKQQHLNFLKCLNVYLSIYLTRLGASQSTLPTERIF